MTGNEADVVLRLKAVLPARWFGDTTPVLDGLLYGLAAAWAWLYGLLTAVIAQTRLATATGLWLDLSSRDFFGTRLSRRSGESDTALRGRIQLELLRERGTRDAISHALIDLTGNAPSIFEPGRPSDTGAWGTALGYGVSGGWGSLSLPFQCFVVAHRPHGNGVAQVAGWGSPSGGYGQGTIEYASIAMSQGQITDTQINSAIAGVLPVSYTAWTRIVS